MKKYFLGKYWIGVIFLILLATGIFCFLQPKPALALNEIPDADVWITNGSVVSIAKHGNIVYLGGTFTRIGPNTGYGVPISASTGSPTSPFPRVNGAVLTVIPDGYNGWYIGGEFTKVGTLTRNRIAHILSDGTVDPDWDPNANGYINTLALNSSGTIVYAGGTFTTIGGQSRNRIAALDAATGSSTAWNPNANIDVNTLVLDSSNNLVYAGGTFTTIGGQARNRIAALDATTGSSTAWNPNANSIVNALALNFDNSIVYAGGSFITIGGQSRNRIAALDAATGSSTAWNPNANNIVNALALSIDGTLVYAGGRFTSAGGQARNRIAALDAATGSSTAWNPNATGTGLITIQTIILNSNGAIVYAGGDFDNIGGQNRNKLAALDASTGLATAWNPGATGTVYSLALNSDDSIVYAGGNFNTLGAQTRNYLAAIDASTGLPTAWNPNANGGIMSLTVNSSGTIVYAGGSFTTIGGQARNRIAALDAVTGLATAWDPNAGTTAVESLALNPSNTIVYAGGSFTTIGGQARNRIAALDAVTGLATAWNPNSNQLIRDIVPNSSGTIVYVCGYFTTIGGQSRSKIAALDAATGSSTAWNPNANSAFVQTIALNSDETIIYAGGDFTTIGGQTRSKVAALDAVTGLATAWNPNANASIYAIALNSSHTIIYTGGYFTIIGGQTRNYIAAIDAVTGLATAWNPNANYGIVSWILNSSNTILYAGGPFTTMGGSPFGGFAEFNSTSITVNPTSGLTTTEAGGTDTFSIVLGFQPLANVTINVSSSDATEGTVSPSSLIFTSTNWSTPQTVTVTGANDYLIDGSVAYSVILSSAVSTDPGYSGLDPTDVSVTNTDNDTAGITVSTISGNTTESGGTATFTVVLDTQPTAAVTIGVSSSDTTEGTVSPSLLTFTSSNWNTPQTVTVTGVDDSLVDGNISYSIILEAASSTDLNYDGIDPADVSVAANTDNESPVRATGGILNITYPSVPEDWITVSPSLNVTSREVSFSLNVGNAALMLVSENPDFTNDSWESYSSERDFTLSAGNGTKTVYFKFRSADGGDSAVKSVTITLNGQAGQAGITIPEGCATATPGSYPLSLNHNFIKLEGLSAIYWLSPDNQRYLFTNRDLFSSWFGNNFSGLKEVSQTEFAAIPFGGNLTVKPGSYLKFDNSDTIYYVRDNTNIYPYTGTPAEVYVIEASFESNYNINCTSPEAAPPYDQIDRDFIKLPSLSAVYWLSPDNTRHLFTNGDTFKSWFDGDFTGLGTVSQAEFDDIPAGVNLTMKPGSYLKFDNSDAIYLATGESNICKTTANPDTLYHVQAGFEIDYNITGNCQ